MSQSPTKTPSPPRLGQSLAEKLPVLCHFWLDARNIPFTPELVGVGSTYSAWWKCVCGNEFQQQVGSKARNFRRLGVFNCAKCAGGNRRPLARAEDSITVLAPWLAHEWSEKNLENPEDLRAKNAGKRFWKCEEEHEWEADTWKRITRKSGCPLCRKSKFSKSKSLAAVKPQFVRFWDEEKNIIKATEIKASGTSKYWWKCALGHPRFATLSNVTRGEQYYCRVCQGGAVMVGENDLFTKFPKLEQEWDGEKNVLNPSELSPSSNRKVWWRCGRCDYCWKTSCSLRTRERAATGCPACAKRMSKPERKLRELLTISLNALPTEAVLPVRWGKRNQKMRCDIVVAEKNLVIEYDGEYWHQERAELDLDKTQKLLENGWKVMRVRVDNLCSLPMVSDFYREVRVRSTDSIESLADDIKLLIEERGW